VLSEFKTALRAAWLGVALLHRLSFIINPDYMRKILLIVLAWLSVAQAMAQTKVGVTGKVTDKTGSEIPGVTVLVKGTGQGTATDVNGVFKLNCAPDSRLVFSFLGYVAQEVPLEGRTTLNVSLASDTKQLDDVVVVGYGTQTKAEFTGAAARVSGDAVKDLPVQSFDQGLAGKATGVSIGQPNGVLNNAPVIRIRGVNSISLSSYPLIEATWLPILRWLTTRWATLTPPILPRLTC
jgi:hypothetical protein